MKGTMLMLMMRSDGGTADGGQKKALETGRERKKQEAFADKELAATAFLSEPTSRYFMLSHGSAALSKLCNIFDSLSLSFLVLFFLCNLAIFDLIIEPHHCTHVAYSSRGSSLLHFPLFR